MPRPNPACAVMVVESATVYTFFVYIVTSVHQNLTSLALAGHCTLHCICIVTTMAHVHLSRETLNNINYKMFQCH